ncbi:MAG TPA: hypothetical protein DEQ02_08020 [Ruminococcaceae bacterium]|nr:hypothetical protein [Oscillospiraceae bacterium]
MFTIFKSTRRLHRLTASFGIVLIIVVFMTNMSERISVPDTVSLGVIMLLAISAWIFLTYWVFNRIAASKLGKINALLFDECRVGAYIQNIRELLAEKRPDYKEIKIFLQLNLSGGYLIAGDAANAEFALGMITGFPNSRAGAVYTLLYQAYWCEYYLTFKSDAEAAYRCLEVAKEAFGSQKFPRSKHGPAFAPLLDEMAYRINIHQGIYDGAEEFFKYLLEKEISLLGRVSKNFMLGKIHSHYGETEKAKAAFEFAAENGGDSYYAEKSKYYLSQL